MDHSLNQYVRWLQGIIEAINDGILVIDSEGIVRLINDEYTKITGVKKEDIIGKPLSEVREGAISPTVLIDKKRRSAIYRKVGEQEYVVDMAPIYYDHQILGVVNVLKSVNEVKALTKELEKSKIKLAQLEKTVGHLHQAKYTFHDIIGEDKEIKNVIELAKRTASSNLNVLIQGESGTGKELFAHAIHNESPRSGYAFVPINCAAIPSSLLESELFGYEEGSFTNSKKGGKIGLFELADHGTLFLDEIGDLSLELQAKLLRVLQEGRIRKIGGLKEQEVNVRIVAATNKDLLQMVAKGRFREDLFYRLNGVQLMIPPLRSRKGDLFTLIDKIVKHKELPFHLTFTADAKKQLFEYHWPGNVRELLNAIHYAATMTDSETIDIVHLPAFLQSNRMADDREDTNLSLKDILERKEREVIIKTLKIYGTSLKGKELAAQKLGISLATLYNKINQLKIKF
ncbi:Fis family transcriptional regulator [Pueribacillus theae]|uniref:Fis family transcriptional regulator n=2 Tax=Pueribacillus theae TaxID=2171751 RepID=A0A2U1JTI9_9BACI|nr:Fis family transcriptional regulator [Pueribacillus theae]